MNLSEVHDLNYCCTVKEEHAGKIGDMVNDVSLIDVVKPILRLCFDSAKRLFRLKKYDTPVGIETVIVICTFNQYRAVEGLIKKLPNVLVICTFAIDCKNNLVVDFVGNPFVSWFHLPKLMVALFKEKGFRRKAMMYHFYDFLNTPGLYNHAVKYLRIIKPKCIIVANDHTFFPRSYFRAAQKLGITTIYTQHASVSAHFPELEFDYTFLDGWEAFDKYTSNGRKYSSNVFFSGSPRFDKIKLMEKNDIFDLGIAINILDEQENILNFIELLPKDSVKIAIRPHPALLNKLFWKEYCHENSIGYSDPLSETPVVFISNCKNFIAGDSAFHLEVALSGKISYFFNFQNEPIIDWYEFIQNGLVSVKTAEEIIYLLTNDLSAEVSKEKVKYYVANFGTHYWGNALELFEATLREINSGKSFTNWENISNRAKVFKIKE